MSINLDNFEVSECEFGRKSPFVLTSPTSLNACSQLNIEPIELVYRSLEHFEETWCHLPLSQIYRIYEEAETDRQAKLLQCREQRKALFYEQGRMTITKGYNNNNGEQSSRSRSSSGAASRKGEQQKQQRRQVQEQEEQQRHHHIRQQQKQRGNNNLSAPAAVSSSSFAPAAVMKKTKSASATSVNRVNFSRNDLQSSRSASTSKENNEKRSNSGGNISKSHQRGRSRNLRGSSSANLIYQKNKRSTSDTESNEGTIHILPVVSACVSENNCNNCGNDGIPISSRSVPDLTRRVGNLDFRKIAAGSAEWMGMSPRSKRNYCLCHLDIHDGDILREYFNRYDDILSSPVMSEEDRKIMERLILKRAKMLEWEKQSQELRELLEIDRIKKYRASQILAQQWHDRLVEKRQLENFDNHRRYLKMQEKLERDQKELKRYLDERDKRIEKYLEELSYKKKRGMLEKQRLEALRQLEVSKAIEKLLDEDKQRRQDMRARLDKRMTEAEIRKRRRERDYWRHVSEMNRLDDIKRALKVEKIEQQAKASVEELRNQIEEKEHRARMNQLRNIQLRDKLIESGAGRHQQQIERARKLHEELLRGFEEWTKKAYELQLSQMEKAGVKHVEEINRRRARATSERILREERTMEMLKRKHEMEERRKEVTKIVIDSKNMKTARHKEEKERFINASRVRAQHAAELRQKLKEKLNPETFDKKAARAEMELRIIKKPSDFNVRFNPKLMLGRRCSCKGRLNSFKSNCHNGIGKSFSSCNGNGNCKDKKKGQLAK